VVVQRLQRLFNRRRLAANGEPPQA